MVRTFWRGSFLGPFQLLGPRGFVDRGHQVGPYDCEVAVPDWIVRKDANEICPTDHIMRYQRDLDRGSFALHANLFHYAMLRKLGGRSGRARYCYAGRRAAAGRDFLSDRARLPDAPPFRCLNFYGI